LHEKKNPNLDGKQFKFMLQAKLDIQNTGLVNKITSVNSKLILVKKQLAKFAGLVNKITSVKSKLVLLKNSW